MMVVVVNFKDDKIHWLAGALYTQSASDPVEMWIFEMPIILL